MCLLTFGSTPYTSNSFGLFEKSDLLASIESLLLFAFPRSRSELWYARRRLPPVRFACNRSFRMAPMLFFTHYYNINNSKLLQSTFKASVLSLRIAKLHRMQLVEKHVLTLHHRRFAMPFFGRDSTESLLPLSHHFHTCEYPKFHYHIDTCPFHDGVP